MLCMCVLDFKMNWNESLPLCEFMCNTNYHSSIGMAPYERKCRTPTCWKKIGVWSFHGPTIVGEMSDKVKQIQDRLKVARSRQKSSANLHRRELDFEVGNKVFVKASPVRGALRLGKMVNWHTATLDLLRFLAEFRMWLLGSRYRQRCPGYTMCSIFRCSRGTL